MPADGVIPFFGGSGRPPRKPPVKYSPAVAEAICEAVATTPRGLDWICARRRDFPDPTMVRRWKHAHAEFRELLEDAYRAKAELLAFQTLEIADDDRFDTETIEHRDGSSHSRMNFEWVGRCKLACDMRLQLAKRLDPARWGDKFDGNLNLGVVRLEDWAEQFR